jgi:predicted Zn-dependent protease
MPRRAGILGAVAAAGLTGCLDEQVARSGIQSKPIDVPTTTEATVTVAARVDQVGRQLVAQNPFLGVEPTFHTIARPDPEVYHPDSNGVFVTEGLVARCPTDPELAAVLASELAKMSVERRTVDRMRTAEPLRPLPDAGGTATGSDPTQLAVQAVFDQKQPRAGKDRRASEDPRAVAEEVLRSAGFDPKALDAVDGVLKDARKNHAVADGLGGRGTKPRWSP